MVALARVTRSGHAQAAGAWRGLHRRVRTADSAEAAAAWAVERVGGMVEKIMVPRTPGAVPTCGLAAAWAARHNNGACNGFWGSRALALRTLPCVRLPRRRAAMCGSSSGKSSSHRRAACVVVAVQSTAAAAAIATSAPRMGASVAGASSGDRMVGNGAGRGRWHLCWRRVVLARGAPRGCCGRHGGLRGGRLAPQR